MEFDSFVSLEALNRQASWVIVEIDFEEIGGLAMENY